MHVNVRENSEKLHGTFFDFKSQKLQNHAVRVLTHSSYDADANQLITELGWDNLEICWKPKTKG